MKNYKNYFKSIEENLSDIEIGDAFLDKVPKTWSMNEKNDKIEFIKI